jgi:hypothetical protein
LQNTLKYCKITLQNLKISVQQPIANFADLDQSLQNKGSIMSVRLVVPRFEKYFKYLRSPIHQLAELITLNEQMNDELRVPDAWLEGLDTTIDHVQSVEDLSTFFVVLDTLQKTLEYNWGLIKLTHPVLGLEMGTSDRHLRYRSDAQVFKPGIHRIRISLVHYWPYKDGQTVNHVRKPASADSSHLDGPEVIGAYALQHPKLLRLQNGMSLPHCKLGALSQGRNFDKTPFLMWDFMHNRATLIPRVIPM